tara:strand:+ start:3366 stop:5387 length:2022 start_codon:yes stop_codon:yes gene_type:complete
MKNLWNDKDSNRYINNYKKYNVSQDLALRIYTTHLLGGEKKLVLHGGGNTSVKTEYQNIFGQKTQVIYVKGSGWDMSNLTHVGMPGLEIKPLLNTLSLKKLTDDKMVNFLRSNLIDSNSPNPSVETLLHAYLPHKYVDHTHSNAFLSLVNLENSELLSKKLFGNKLGIVPYVMPGFDLAKLCYQVFQSNSGVEGLVLLNHGIFTFGDSAKQSYSRMIKYVSIVENFISKNQKKIVYLKTKKNKKDQALTDIMNTCRNAYTAIDINKWIFRLHSSSKDITFSLRKDLKQILNKGPVTPDHVIRIKSKPLIIRLPDIENLKNLIFNYVKKYKEYFQKYKSQVKNAKISDALPRIIVIQGVGYFSIGRNSKEAKISSDIFCSMQKSIFDSCNIGNFKSINDKEIFKMEYWPLERAKLNNTKRKQAEGNIVVITGGAGTIGIATAKKFLNEGAEVIILDKIINLKTNKYREILEKCFCIECDLTKDLDINSALQEIFHNFGGIDVLISNAGAAFQGSIDSVDEKIIRKSFEINFFSHQKITSLVVRFMKKQNIGGSIMFNISKQAINPGKNFGPYGLPKSSTLFLMKQYALECGEFKIRVNGVNADRIQSGILNEELIKERAKARSTSKQKYLSNNLLQTEVLAEDVAEAFYSQFLLKKTTGNIITVDGGNMEASLR